MKKYIFLTPEIGNMGGTQMFVYNKSKYLNQNGWRVVIVFFRDSQILIKHITDYNCIYSPLMAWGVPYYFPFQVKHEIRRIADIINVSSDDEVVVESHLFHLAYWGELLAARVAAKHIINMLEEEIKAYSEKVSQFLDFKLRRWEFLNASVTSLKRIFKQYYKDEYVCFEFKSTFHCSNVVTDDDNHSATHIFPIQVDKVILSIGRLDKPYIPVMIEQIKEVVHHHQDRSFGIIFIGASSDGRIEESIKAKYEDFTNVQCVFLGYMYPIPSNYITIANVAISTSNSVLVSYNHGVPTIAVDALDSYAIGIYGVTTNNKVFRHGEEQIDIGKYLETILFDETFTYDMCNNRVKEQSDNALEDHFNSQLEFIYRTNPDGIYYDVLSIPKAHEWMRYIGVRLWSICKRHILLFKERI